MMRWLARSQRVSLAAGGKRIPALPTPFCIRVADDRVLWLPSVSQLSKPQPGKISRMKSMEFMYKGPYSVVLYSIALACLIGVAYGKVNYSAVVAMGVLFFVWDAGFVLHPQSFVGRDTKQILEHCRDAETLMSYFIGFYAVVFAILFTEADKRTAFLQACRQADVRLPLVGAPLVLACIPMLFIPVQFEKDAHGHDVITKGVKGMMFVNLYFEKLVVFTFVYDILRISRALMLTHSTGSGASALSAWIP